MNAGAWTLVLVRRFEVTFGYGGPQDAAVDVSCFAAVFLCPFSVDKAKKRAVRLLFSQKPTQLNPEESILEYQRLRPCAEYRKPAGDFGQSYRRSQGTV